MRQSKYKLEIMCLRAEGKTYAEIRKISGASKGLVSYFCEQLPDNQNITKNHREQIGLYGDALLNQWDGDLKNNILELYNNGVPLTNIADVLKVRWVDLKKFFVALNLPLVIEHKLSGYELVRRRRRNLKLMLAIYVGNKKCKRCGYDKCLVAMDFHHLDPKKKELNISGCNSWKKLKIESEKCILLCANCHRELHAGIWNVDDLQLTDSSIG